MDMDFAIYRSLVRTVLPHIRFLFVGSWFCSTLPSDAPSRRPPLRFASTSPPSGCAGDLHPQAVEHARHTTKPLRGGKDRDLVHKSSVSATHPTVLTSDLACTHALRRAILQRGYAWRQARPLSSRRGRRALFPERAPCPSIQSTLKANAVPIAASSSAIASTGPT